MVYASRSQCHPSAGSSHPRREPRGRCQELHRVQSAVSYQLRKLERQLGLKLLDRDGYRVRLTAAGEAVLAEGKRVLAACDVARDTGASALRRREARLTVIADGILPLESALTALKTLAEERIPTRIQLKVEFLKGVQYRFERDDADLMLVKDYEPRPQLLSENPSRDFMCIVRGCGPPTGGQTLGHPRSAA